MDHGYQFLCLGSMIRLKLWYILLFIDNKYTLNKSKKNSKNVKRLTMFKQPIKW